MHQNKGVQISAVQLQEVSTVLGVNEAFPIFSDVGEGDRNVLVLPILELTDSWVWDLKKLELLKRLCFTNFVEFQQSLTIHYVQSKNVGCHSIICIDKSYLNLKFFVKSVIGV